MHILKIDLCHIKHNYSNSSLLSPLWDLSSTDEQMCSAVLITPIEIKRREPRKHGHLCSLQPAGTVEVTEWEYPFNADLLLGIHFGFFFK